MTKDQDDSWVRQRLERWRSARDGEALGELFKWQRSRAYATAFRLLGNDAAAEDAVQQAFLKLMTRTHGFESPESFRIAVYHAVVQCALNDAQSARARVRREQSMGQANARDSQTPERSAENAEALRLLQIEIDRLAPDDRSAVVLCCQEGLSLTDAAGVLGQPRETVRDRVLRTLKGLRERLGRLGVTLSSMALVGLLQEGGHLPEPSSLCKWLDAQWQASSCGQVAPAKVQAQPPAQILSGLNAPRSILPAATVTVTGALLFVLCLAFLNPPPGNAVTAPSPEAEPLYAERANASAIPQEEEKEMKKSLMAASILAAMSMTQAGAGDGDAKLPGPTTGPAQRTESKQETVKAAVSASLKKEAPKAATNSGQQVPAIKELQGERE